MQFVVILALFLPFSCLAANFDGVWVLDTRTAQEKQDPNNSCGIAVFDLHQDGNDIIGEHTYYLPDCSRLNEGGTVVGIVAGSKGTLYVTSGRNGAIVKGLIALKKGKLHWTPVKEIRAGDTPGDSPIILGKGILHRDNKTYSITLKAKYSIK